ncbi:hypothetical protein BDV41DRAFT_518903, partial [Aspergillus transmontanensis]
MGADYGVLSCPVRWIEPCRDWGQYVFMVHVVTPIVQHTVQIVDMLAHCSQSDSSRVPDTAYLIMA